MQDFEMSDNEESQFLLSGRQEESYLKDFTRTRRNRRTLASKFRCLCGWVLRVSRGGQEYRPGHMVWPGIRILVIFRMMSSGALLAINCCLMDYNTHVDTIPTSTYTQLALISHNHQCKCGVTVDRFVHCFPTPFSIIYALLPKWCSNCLTADSFIKL